MTITPIKNKVLVELKQAESMSRGGIHIPDKAQESNIFGTVRATGADVPDHIRDGDEVMVLRTSGTHFRMKGVSFITLCADQIHARVES